jgi:hypothetical protein
MRRPGASAPAFYSQRRAGNRGRTRKGKGGRGLRRPLMASGSGQWCSAIGGRRRRVGNGDTTFSRCRQLNRRGAQKTKRSRSLAGGPPGERGRARADCTVSPRRCKPRPNLGRVCVTANKLPKMRRAAGLGFPGPGQNQTDSDVRGPFALGRWRYP